MKMPLTLSQDLAGQVDVRGIVVDHQDFRCSFHLSVRSPPFVMTLTGRVKLKVDP